MIMVFLVSVGCLLSAQEITTGTEDSQSEEATEKEAPSSLLLGTEDGKNSENTSTDDKTSENLPAGYMNITLGMSLEEVKKALSDNSYFDYRGDPDVSMLASPNQQLIESSGYSFIEKGYFQFNNKILFIMTLVFNRERLDFYTMHMLLEEKYGKADRLDPKGAYWENSSVALSLEKPLSIKYMDKNILEEITKERKDIEERGSINKEEFLKLF
ncbi:MAG: hypothetical protein RBT69_01620 [Spirochaetia bacterium]|nr:hypothetical protein [Spirochaetia bacterium]